MNERARRVPHVTVIRAAGRRAEVSEGVVIAVRVVRAALEIAVEAVRAAGRESRVASVEKADAVERAAVGKVVSSSMVDNCASAGCQHAPSPIEEVYSSTGIHVVIWKVVITTS